MALSMERWSGKVAVVTGASSGIGAAIAEVLADHGMKVAALARRTDRLEALLKKCKGKRGSIHPIVTDITKEGDILAAFNFIRENLGPVHVLINNAGTMKPSDLTDGKTDDWRQVLEVNVLGLSTATREAVQEMRRNNIDGHIIHINSVVGHKVVNVPYLNVYPASKFAVTALANTLRYELLRMKSKIKVTSLSPGLVDTELIVDLKKKGAFDNYEPADMRPLKPEDVASAVVYTLSTPPHVQIQELTIAPVDELA